MWQRASLIAWPAVLRGTIFYLSNCGNNCCAKECPAWVAVGNFGVSILSGCMNPDSRPVIKVQSGPKPIVNAEWAVIMSPGLDRTTPQDFFSCEPADRAKRLIAQECRRIMTMAVKAALLTRVLPSSQQRGSPCSTIGCLPAAVRKKIVRLSGSVLDNHRRQQSRPQGRSTSLGRGAKDGEVLLLPSLTSSCLSSPSSNDRKTHRAQAELRHQESDRMVRLLLTRGGLSVGLRCFDAMFLRLWQDRDHEYCLGPFAPHRRGGAQLITADAWLFSPPTLPTLSPSRTGPRGRCRCIRAVWHG